MSRYIGDFAAGRAIRLRFNTVNGTPPVPTTLSAGSVAIRKDGADVAPTPASVVLSVDQGGVTGLHVVTVDPALDLTGTLTPGADYAVRLAGTSNVGGTTVAGIIVGEFSIANRSIKAGDPVTLPAGERGAIATAVENQIMDEADSRAVLAAIVAKINATDANLAGLSVAAIAAAVWDEVKAGHVTAGTFGALLDAAISSRLAGSSYVAPPTPPTVNQIASGILADPTHKIAADASGAVSLPATAPDGYGGAGGSGASLAGGLVVAGSTTTAVVVSGLPPGKKYRGQRLYHLPSGESRKIVAQSFASGNYTFTFNAGATGNDDTTGPFDAIASGDAVYPIP